MAKLVRTACRSARKAVASAHGHGVQVRGLTALAAPRARPSSLPLPRARVLPGTGASPSPRVTNCASAGRPQWR
eukprot:CAMPEP_0197509392 /NCGR_PEP_ID=MMETSP1312-20131121/39979_1 /TAXON_ID=464262 /ORGANISM="Genus nov. species nov., Strain RCC2335" /LENGTH=73 /DNA_ID=CAMNT_0043057255 /DNA_START=14 /DNA_END=232 /DNA_ORIENTATION=-